MILAGDVGGTKVHLALYNFVSGKLSPVRDEKFPATEFACLDDVVKEFLSPEKSGQPDVRDQIIACCFGVPGPVRDGRLKLTNLPWTLDARDLQRTLGIQHIFLINDLEANGYGIPELAQDKVFTIHAGDASSVGHRGLIAAGTGLGECLLIWDPILRRHLPIPSEGGHTDFPARNDTEIALLKYLQRKLNGRVSAERVVSGIGMQNVYEFLRDDQKMEEPEWLRDRMRKEDPNAVIGESADDGSSEICVRTIELFTSAYGAEAGNLALKVLAMGGLYIGGGIGPKILKFMSGGVFMQAFLDKGRMSALLETVPVRLILDDTCALLGAAAYAEARAAELSGHSERQASVHAA
jgi:glucokinase